MPVGAEVVGVSAVPVVEVVGVSVVPVVEVVCVPVVVVGVVLVGLVGLAVEVPVVAVVGGERLGAERERVGAEVGDAFFEPAAQAGVDRGGQPVEVAFHRADRSFGGGAVAVAFPGGLGDGLEGAFEGPGVAGGDQAAAGAPAGDQQGRADAEQGARREADGVQAPNVRSGGAATGTGAGAGH